MPENIIKYLPETPDDQRPLPLLVAGKWGFDLQHYTEIENLPGVYLYSLLDWSIALTGDNGRQALKDFKRSKAFAQVVEKVHQLPYIGRDGKKYSSDFGTDNVLYTFAQHVRPAKATQALEDILKYLAAAGVKLDEFRLNPSQAADYAAAAYFAQGKESAWIAERLEGKVSNKAFRAALTAAVMETLENWQYAQAQDDVYLGLWRRTAAQLKGDLGLKKHHSLRDNQPRLALAYQRITEDSISMMLGDAQELTWREAESVVKRVAKMIGAQARETSSMLGIDLATGKQLFDSGSPG